MPRQTGQCDKPKEVCVVEDILLPKEDLWCYRLDPAPPKWDLQEYIAAFVKERDAQYFVWFLSYYESNLNKKIKSIMIRYFMPGHFADLKQAYVTGLWKALENYDISHEVPFLIYKERYVEREVLDYIRTARTGYTAQSTAEYDKLRKTMAIWTEKYNRKTDTITLNALASEIGESVQNIAEILEGGIRNENAVALYHRHADDDSEKTLLEVVPDLNSDPAFLFQRTERNTRLWDAFDKLDMRSRPCLPSTPASAWVATVRFLWTSMTRTLLASRRRNPSPGCDTPTLPQSMGTAVQTP